LTTIDNRQLATYKINIEDTIVKLRQPCLPPNGLSHNLLASKTIHSVPNATPVLDAISASDYFTTYFKENNRPAGNVE
jgi:hypothetical protein